MSPSTTDKIYPVAKIAMMVDLLGEENVSVEDALADVGLSPEQLRIPETRVSGAQVLQSCRNALKLSRNPQFAYRASSKFCVATNGMFGFAALSSPDFRETIAFSVAYHRLATPLMHVDFREEGGTATWMISALPHLEIDAPVNEFIVKLHMGVLLSLHRKMLGATFKPARVDYALSQPPDASDATAFFGCPVLYDKPENRFQFDAAWLDRQPDFGNKHVYAELRQLCDGLLKDFELGAGVAGQVRKLILSNLSRPVGFERVAEDLNMSGRSLRRRLRDEGTSFGRLADELRFKVAVKYVCDTDLSVEDIAYTLGFSDASSFRHAFRRWTNTAPQEYRRARIDARIDRNKIETSDKSIRPAAPCRRSPPRHDSSGG